jgi:hypothetical protein
MTQGEWVSAGLAVGVPLVVALMGTLWWFNARLTKVETKQESMEQLRQLMTEFVLKMRDQE